MTTKTYTVHRSMQDGATEYLPGSTREMTPADAAELVAMGALSLKGEAPADRAPAVQHTFGSAPSAVNDGGYTVAGSGSVSLDRAPERKPAKPLTKA